MNGKTILGVVITAVVVFIWGFLYWGVNPLPYQTWTSASDDAAAQAAVAAVFPETGIYVVPGIASTPEQQAELRSSGPTVFAFVDHEPPSAMDPTSFAWGFVQNLVVAALMVLLFGYVDGTANRLKLAALAGVMCVVLADGSDIIWWDRPFAWTAYLAIYNFSVFVIAAAVLSPFVPARDAAGG